MTISSSTFLSLTPYLQPRLNYHQWWLRLFKENGNINEAVRLHCQTNVEEHLFTALKFLTIYRRPVWRAEVQSRKKQSAFLCQLFVPLYYFFPMGISSFIKYHCIFKDYFCAFQSQQHQCYEFVLCCYVLLCLRVERRWIMLWEQTEVWMKL